MNTKCVQKHQKSFSFDNAGFCLLASSGKNICHPNFLGFLQIFISMLLQNLMGFIGKIDFFLTSGNIILQIQIELEVPGCVVFPLASVTYQDNGRILICDDNITIALVIWKQILYYSEARQIPRRNTVKTGRNVAFPTWPRSGRPWHCNGPMPVPV